MKDLQKHIKEFQCMVWRKRKSRNRNVRRNLRVFPEQALMSLPNFECLRLKSQRWRKQHLLRKPSNSNYFVPLCSKSSVYPSCKKCDFALQAWVLLFTKCSFNKPMCSWLKSHLALPLNWDTWIHRELCPTSWIPSTICHDVVFCLTSKLFILGPPLSFWN